MEEHLHGLSSSANHLLFTSLWVHTQLADGTSCCVSTRLIYFELFIKGRWSALWNYCSNVCLRLELPAKEGRIFLILYSGAHAKLLNIFVSISCVVVQFVTTEEHNQRSIETNVKTFSVYLKVMHLLYSPFKLDANIQAWYSLWKYGHYNEFLR